MKVWLFPSVQLEIKNLHIHETPHSNYSEYLQGEILELFEALRKRILNLDASVKEEFKKFYIAYKTTNNFADIVPQENRLLLLLTMQFDEINDSKGLCRDVTNVGHWGNGDVEVSFSFLDQIDVVMFLARQAFHKYSYELNE